MALTASKDSHPPSALARLLETEARLERMVAEAKDRADQRHREAESQFRGRHTALEAELAEVAIRAGRQHAADCDDRLALLTREHELALTRLRNIGPERIAALASWVADQALATLLPRTGP